MQTSWLYPESLEEAKSVQKFLSHKLVLQDQFDSLNFIGGMDVSNNLFDPEQMIYATTVVLDSQNLNVVEKEFSAEKQVFPYIPGFLGFREAPSLVHAYEKLQNKPDLLFVDGHGISHPRGLGIASHIGALIDIPTIGVAKSILIGKPETILGDEPGSQTPLVWQDKIIGMLLRTKKRSNPLIISSGHRVSLHTAVDLVKNLLRGYRLPEPTRNAHLAANAFRKSFKTL